MKKVLLMLLLSGAALITMAQQKGAKTTAPDPNKKLLILETACGQCQFGLPGKSCDLAVRFNDKAYFVDGTNIDQHGDAHAEDGFCNAVRKAKVQGEVVDNRFKVTYFQLEPDSTKK